MIAARAAGSAFRPTDSTHLARAVAAILVLLALLWPRAGHADDRGASDEATDSVTLHLQRGIEFYAEKEYELAIVEFRAGYALDPRPDFLFALAQAERLGGDCPTAVVYYQRFLQTDPDANQAEAAHVNMKRCARALESGPDGRPRQPTRTALERAEDTQPRPAPMPAPDPTAGVQRDAGSPWYRDSIGTSLLAAGVVGLGVGTGFWVARGSAEQAALDADRYDDYVAHIESARRDRTIALVGFGAGAVLAGAAVYRFLTHSPRSTGAARGKRGTSSSLALTNPTGGAVTIGIAGWF